MLGLVVNVVMGFQSASGKLCGNDGVFFGFTTGGRPVGSRRPLICSPLLCIGVARDCASASYRAIRSPRWSRPFRASFSGLRRALWTIY